MKSILWTAVFGVALIGAATAEPKVDMFGISPGMSKAQVDTIFAQQKFKCSPLDAKLECEVPGGHVVAYFTADYVPPVVWAVSTSFESAGSLSDVVRDVTKQYRITAPPEMGVVDALPMVWIIKDRLYLQLGGTKALYRVLLQDDRIVDLDNDANSRAHPSKIAPRF